MTETKSPRNKLFLMMVMEFFIWGAWLPLIFGYLPSLGFTPIQQAWILNAFPLSAIVGMFFSNQFADRHFAAEKFLGVQPPRRRARDPRPWDSPANSGPSSCLMLVHCLFYVPTISIANSIAFAHMKDAKKEFGLVRMGGTLGWILAAWPFTFIFVDWARVKSAAPKGLVDWLGTALASGLTGQALKQATRWTFIVAGIVSLVLAAYSLLLPHTPRRRERRGHRPRSASPGSKRSSCSSTPSSWSFGSSPSSTRSFTICYFNWTGTFLGTAPEAGGVGIAGNWIMPVMSLGQVSEILTMLVLGVVLKKLGWRFTMLIGILGHAARFAVYAFFPSEPWMIVTIQVLHGICYAFFFATVYIFVDTYFPKDVRSSAQGLFNVMILGLGVLAANTLGPWLIQSVFTAGGITDFRSMFLLPCLTALGAAIVLALAFKPPALAETDQGRL
ncbi:MAG: MFS transporter [Candidatus Moduliflexus flocculans]|nr:MFS transporter [Candidatus Moduliflexus flocculans]